MSTYTYEATIMFAHRIEAEVIAIGLNEWLKRELFTFYDPMAKPVIGPKLLKYRPAKRRKPGRQGKTPDYVTHQKAA